MTVKELRDALPYNADDAEVVIAPPGCIHGHECVTVAVLVQSNPTSNKQIILVAEEIEGVTVDE